MGIAGSARGTLFSTKGDANPAGDPERLTFPGRVGLVKLAVPGVGFVVAWMQYLWRMGATLVAAIIFFACAELVLLRRDRPAPAARRTTAGPRATIGDPNAIWTEHVRWMNAARSATARA